MKIIAVTALSALTMFCSLSQSYGLNYDPLALDPVPTLGTGFTYDQVSGININSDAGVYGFNFAFTTVFSITDAYVVGDTFRVYDFGILVLTTTVGAGAPFAVPGDATGEAAWVSGNYSIGQIVLAAGAHSLTIQGDGAGGIPAGFYTRIDLAPSVPEAGSTAVFLGLSLLGLALLRRLVSNRLVDIKL